MTVIEMGWYPLEVRSVPMLSDKVIDHFPQLVGGPVDSSASEGIGRIFTFTERALEALDLANDRLTITVDSTNGFGPRKSLRHGPESPL